MSGRSSDCSGGVSRRKRPYNQMLKPVGYAKRLSRYEDKGQCGDDVDEEHEAITEIQTKINQVAAAIQQAGYVVAHTGAGISTAAGIPDFRGKHGIWTREKRGEPLPDHEKCWNNAVPTLGHMALVGMLRAGKLQAVVSQNIDGLHLRSGIPRDRLSELHGNMFMERCETCGFEVMRSCDVGGIGFRPTGRNCVRSRCGARLVDSLLDWEDELPEPDHSRAEWHAKQCQGNNGLALCLGTSMQMCPARDLPTQADKMVIVNLQPTVMDDEAWMVVRGKIDDFMYGLMRALHIPIPIYQRCETFMVRYEVYTKHSKGTGGGGGGRPCISTTTIKVFVGESSPHDIPSGYIAAVSLSFKPRSPDHITFQSNEEVRLTDQPFDHHARTTAAFPPDSCPFCRKNDSSSSDGARVDVEVKVDFEPMPEVRAGAGVLPSQTPPTWHGSHTVDLSKNDRIVMDHSVVLMEVNYDTLYSPTSPAPASAGATVT